MKGRQIRKLIIRTHEKHVGTVRRAEVKISDHFFYQATCRCGYISNALSDVSIVSTALENHVKNEVVLAVSKAIS